MINNDVKRLVYLSRFLSILFCIITIALAGGIVSGLFLATPFIIPYTARSNLPLVSLAVLFFICALNLLLIIYEIKKAWVLTLLAFLLCCLSSLALISSLKYGISHSGPIYYNPMAPNSIFCFLLVLGAICSLQSRNINDNNLALAYGLSILLFCVALIFMSGYFSAIEHAQIWDPLFPMSFQSTIGFSLLSLSLIFLVIYKSLIQKISILRFFPILMAVGLFVSTILLSGAIYVQHKHISINNIAFIVLVTGTTISFLIGILCRYIYFASKNLNSVQNLLSITRATFEAVVDGVLVYDTEGRIIDFNQKFIDMWAIKREAMLKYDKFALRKDIMSKMINAEEYQLQTQYWDSHYSEEIRYEVHLKNGNIYLLHGNPQIINNEVIGKVWSCYDKTLQKRLENDLLHQATHDTLTGLPNKTLILDLIDRSINAAKYFKRQVAIFILDIDDFSKVNDVFGRSKGDVILKNISERLTLVLSNIHILGRFGGDEFILIHPEMSNEEDMLAIINKLTHSLSDPFKIDGHNISVTSSIGVAKYPHHAENREELISKAHIAMLKAKKESRNSFRFYSEEMKAGLLENIELKHELHSALKNHEFVLYYQPIFNLRNNEPVKLEVLIRWQHPQRGLIAPMEFMPAAEDLGLINDIGEWVLINACKQLAQWQAAGLDQIKVSVNVSAQQFKSDLIEHSVKVALAESKLSPTYLEIELTEGVLLTGGIRVNKILESLTKIGVLVSIDDFGVGYSSFSYLREFKVYSIKIDKTFIKEIPGNKNDEVIVRAMINLGKNLDFLVLAEGIETQPQLDFLKTNGCDLGQGFMFAKPMPAAVCFKFLQSFR